jgi:hypothetical protein
MALSLDVTGVIYFSAVKLVGRSAAGAYIKRRSSRTVRTGSFYGKARGFRARCTGDTVCGTLWSYVLDLPAILTAFALRGGVWFC